MEADRLLQKLSNIARIKINDSEKEAFANKISNLIKWEHKIGEVDTTNIAPMFNVLEWLGQSAENLREDRVTILDCSAELIQNAPDKEDSFIAVPKIIE